MKDFRLLGLGLLSFVLRFRVLGCVWGFFRASFMDSSQKFFSGFFQEPVRGSFHVSLTV